MRSPADSKRYRSAVRVAPAGDESPGAVLVLLEMRYRLPLQLEVAYQDILLLGLEGVGASSRRQCDLVRDFLAGQFGALGFEVAIELAHGLSAEIIGVAGAVAFVGLDARGVSAVDGRLFPSARHGLGRGERWPLQRKARGRGRR